jgi:hypothetical protein
LGLVSSFRGDIRRGRHARLALFDNLDEQEEISVTGLDQAEPAITYAVKSGLLDKAISTSIETEQLSGLAKKDLASVDLVTSTGADGYVTEKSFACL